jgi:hypothetical protein
MPDNNTPVPDITEDELLPPPIETPGQESIPDISISNEVKAEIKKNSLGNSPNADESFVIALPSSTQKEAVNKLDDIPKQVIEDKLIDPNWLSVLKAGLENSPQSDFYADRLHEQSSQWGQGIDFNGKPLEAGYPNFKNKPGSILKGPSAVLRFQSHIGTGTPCSVPLWHSGFWITVKPSTDQESLEIEREILNDLIKLGSSTYGLTHSSFTVKTQERLVNHVLGHVHSTSINVEDFTVSQLRSLIAPNDIQTIIWSMAAANHPRGFKYQRACINEAEKCNHIVTDTINLSTLQYVDKNMLTDWQINHMSNNSSKSRSLEDIKRYKEDLERSKETRISIASKNTNITIHTPSINEYFESGHRWISSIVNIVESNLGKNMSDEDKEIELFKHAHASSLRQYSHWIKSIDFNGSTIEDRETIESVLGSVSQDDNIRNSIMEAITKYISNSTLSLIAIEKYICPACQKEQYDASHSLPRFSSLIALDAIQTFFTLHTQRLSKLIDR